MKHCKLSNAFRGEKSKKEEVKLKTQNEKTVEKQLLESRRNSTM